uniref:Mitochondrial fission 1 protein n=1 Tax=Heterorhabditis bacteriophora TaxID=37862 RepID=A0A1I7XG22_HETBA
MLIDVENILDERVDPYDLEKFRDIYETQKRRGVPSAVATFDYSHALIRSTKSDVAEGINLLEKLLREEPDDGCKRDCVYFLAIANARLKISYLSNIIVKEIQLCLNNTSEGFLGLAILGGSIAVFGGILAILVSRK